MHSGHRSYSIWVLKSMYIFFNIYGFSNEKNDSIRVKTHFQLDWLWLNNACHYLRTQLTQHSATPFIPIEMSFWISQDVIFWGRRELQMSFKLYIDSINNGLVTLVKKHQRPPKRIWVWLQTKIQFHYKRWLSIFC